MLFDLILSDSISLNGILSEICNYIESPLPKHIGSNSTCSTKSYICNIAGKDLFDGMLKKQLVTPQ